MPLIRPNFTAIESEDNSSADEIEVSSEISREEIINDILREGGMPENKLIPKSAAQTMFKRTLDKNGASIENASKTIAHVMNRSKFDNSKLKAAELVLDLHGIRDKEGNMVKQPIFQFLIKDSDVNIQNIFSPVRHSASLAEGKE